MSWAVAFFAGLILGGFLTAWVVLVFTVLAMRTEARQERRQLRAVEGGRRA